MGALRLLIFYRIDLQIFQNGDYETLGHSLAKTQNFEITVMLPWQLTVTIDCWAVQQQSH